MCTHNQPVRGRGATCNPANRFNQCSLEAFDDGWGSLDAPVDKLKTELHADSCNSALVFNQSPDIPFDRSLNPYRGCEHGCVYCFARPSHAWLDCSPGLDFETRIFYKQDAASLLRGQIGKRSYCCKPLALGANTDAYQPAERKLGITRSLLKVLYEHRHPVAITTKSALVERDIDLLAAMSEQNLVHVMLSVTTLDRKLARSLEPRAAAPQRRLETIRRLRNAGIPVGVLIAPVIPVLNDAEIETILDTVRAAGAVTAGYIMLRLPHELGELFSRWLELHRPLTSRHVMNRLKEMRNGKCNDSRFGTRMRGTGIYAQLIRKRFDTAKKKLDFPGMPEFDCSRFRITADAGGQLSLLP
jgi:DNA repair photolyase